jgi:hypothetical protein
MNLMFTPFIEAFVLEYSLPALIKRDLSRAILALLSASKALLNEKKCFHFRRFNAASYVFASALLAREMVTFVAESLTLTLALRD